MLLWPGFERLVWNYRAVALNGCVKGALQYVYSPAPVVSFSTQLNKGFLSMSFTLIGSLEKIDLHGLNRSFCGSLSVPKYFRVVLRRLSIAIVID